MRLDSVLRVKENHMKDQNLDVTTLDTQRYVALDLEYNQPSGTIIQVGVAIGSASQNDQEYIVRRWDLQVNESISEFITQLTGITDEDCKAGVSLEQCAQELGELLREQEVFLNPVTWGGGDSAAVLALTWNWHPVRKDGWQGLVPIGRRHRV